MDRRAPVISRFNLSRDNPVQLNSSADMRLVMLDLLKGSIHRQLAIVRT